MLETAVTIAWITCLLAGACSPIHIDPDESDDPSSEPSSSSGPQLPEFGTPRATGNLPPDLREASGIVQSAWDDDRFWLHNDSSHPPELYALSADGTLLSVLVLPVDNRDWEDISRGPCDADDHRHTCLFIGEIGDNRARYPSIAVHRIREPEVLPEGWADLAAEDVQTMHLVYPDGPRDAESLVVDPNGDLWILTKRPRGVTRLYTATFQPNRTPFALEFVREFNLAEIGRMAGGDHMTAADWDPHRELFLVRLYTLAAVFPVPGGDLRNLFDHPPTIVPTGIEIQGEAIAWTRDGGYIHTSEGRNATIWRVDLNEDSEDE